MDFVAKIAVLEENLKLKDAQIEALRNICATLKTALNMELRKNSILLKSKSLTPAATERPEKLQKAITKRREQLDAITKRPEKLQKAESKQTKELHEFLEFKENEAKALQEQLDARTKRREKFEKAKAKRIEDSNKRKLLLEFLLKAEAEAKRIQILAAVEDAEERKNLVVVNSKFAIALQGEIERRKHDKNPIKFKLQRKFKIESKLEIALKEAINHRKLIASIKSTLCGKIQAS